MSDQGLPNRGRESFGPGVVRFSPAVRQDSSDQSASMYVPGHGFVETSNSSIVEPQRFVGVRRKSAISPSRRNPEMERGRDFEHPVNEVRRLNDPDVVDIVQTSPVPQSGDAETSKECTDLACPSSPHISPITSRSDPISSKSRQGDFTCNHTPVWRPPYVLIVEDNSVNALILATFLKKRGCPFVKAENGLLAVQAVQARPEGFDVILMDIQSNSTPLCLS